MRLLLASQSRSTEPQMLPEGGLDTQFENVIFCTQVLLLPQRSRACQVRVMIKLPGQAPGTLVSV